MEGALNTTSPFVNIMIRAALKASQSLLRDFGEIENLQVSRKGPGDFVSIADKRSEQTLYKALHGYYPDYNFLMEEGGEIIHGQPGGPTWIVDPLDGTLNFLHGIPHFAISIALRVGQEIIAGVVYDPVKNEIFWAHRGHGAFLNQRRLRVSVRRQPVDSIIATSLPGLKSPLERSEFSLKTMRKLMPKVCSIRCLGASSLDLAYVAAGRYEGFWDYEACPWDIAAGLLLVREAGGFVGDENQKDQCLATGCIRAGNEKIYRFLCDEIPLLRN